jgi:hypothetical protein
VKLKRPRGSTHARISTSNKASAVVEVKDLDCFQGVAGKIVWLKGSKKNGFRELGESDFDGEYEP